MKAEAKDLRIGNIIYSPDKGRNGYTYVNHRIISDIASNPNHKYEYIPLTENWLIRMGFEKRSGTIIWSYGKMEITQTSESFLFEYGIIISNWVKIKHVHDLQNLFRFLTGTELEVKV